MPGNEAALVARRQSLNVTMVRVSQNKITLRTDSGMLFATGFPADSGGEMAEKWDSASRVPGTYKGSYTPGVWGGSASVVPHGPPLLASTLSLVLPQCIQSLASAAVGPVINHMSFSFYILHVAL